MAEEWVSREGREAGEGKGQFYYENVVVILQ